MVIAREQRRARDAAIRLSTIDNLTGLFNRTFFFAAVEREIARSARSGRGFCLLMMDLDELKQINDRHGHFFGDRVLRGVGEVIREGGRRIDTAARYGGDEFVVLLPETDPTGRLRPRREDPDGRRRAAGRCRGHAHPAVDLVGVVSYPEDGRTSDELMITADTSMYRSKRAGKNRVTGVPVMDQSAAGRPAGLEPLLDVAPEPRRPTPRASPPTSRCRIGRMADPEIRRAAARPVAPRGFATRAILAAHRLPVVDQAPDVRPDLPDRDVLGGRRRGARRRRQPRDPRLRLRPPRQPDGRRLRRRGGRARGRRGRVRLRVRHGRDPRRPRDGPVGRRPGRRHPGLVRDDAGPARQRLRPARGDDRVRRRDRSRGRRARPSPLPRRASSTPRRSPTRRSSSPITSRSPTSPIGSAPCTSSTTRSPRHTSAGRSSSARTS